MSTITIQLDYVLAQYTKQRKVQLEQGELPKPVTVQQVLDRLKVPYGMVGHIVCDGKLLEASCELTAPCLVKMFGLYSGG